MAPTRDEIEAGLERVLASEPFAGTIRLSRFLRYIVERALAGDADRLKEYVIGVEVFDRGERYDPRVDSIVRVEAGRLRTKLEEYYRGPGRSDAIAIGMEKGSYAPQFVRRAPSESEPGTAASTPANSPAERSATSDATADGLADGRSRAAGLRRAGLATAIAFVAAIAAAAFWLAADRADPAGDSELVVAVLPFASYAADSSATTLATQLTERVTAELVRLARFSVVASTSAREAAETGGELNDVARALGADFLLEARLSTENGVLRVDARLIDGPRTRKVWVETITGDPADTDDVARRVAAGAAAAQLHDSP